MMSRAISFIFILLILLLNPTPSIGQIEYFHFDNRLAEKLMFSAVNRIRYENNLSILSRDENLAKTASSHTRDMIHRNFFDHINPDGVGPRERAREFGVPYPISENLGILSSYGLDLNNVIEELLKSMLDSPKHRANLLNPNISKIGIAFAQDRNHDTNIISSDEIADSHLGYGTIVVCQLFMKRGLKNIYGNPIPDKVKKGDRIILSAVTYADFDNVLIELQETNGGRTIRTTEIVLFERFFEENIRFPKTGEFDLSISGINYKDNVPSDTEELATFKITVE
ncbi:MAG: CAP domain-containing protein [bacterium]